MARLVEIASFDCPKKAKSVTFFRKLRRVYKYGVFSGPYFPAFGLNTERYVVRTISPYSVRMRENTDQKKLRIWKLSTQCSYFVLKNRIYHQYIRRFHPKKKNSFPGKSAQRKQILLDENLLLPNSTFS